MSGKFNENTRVQVPAAIHLSRLAYVERTIELADGTKVETLEKHIMRYQQLFATFALRQKLSEGIKGGVIWHTQGRRFFLRSRSWSLLNDGSRHVS